MPESIFHHGTMMIKCIGCQAGEGGNMPLQAPRLWTKAEASPAAAARRLPRTPTALLTAGACVAAALLLVVPLLTLEADARGGGGGGGGGHGRGRPRRGIGRPRPLS